MDDLEMMFDFVQSVDEDEETQSVRASRCPLRPHAPLRIPCRDDEQARDMRRPRATCALSAVCCVLSAVCAVCAARCR